MFKNKRLFTLFLFYLSLVSLLSMLSIGALWVFDKYRGFSEESQRIRRAFVDDQKQRAKAEVERAVGYIKYDVSRVQTRYRTEIKSRTQEAIDIAEAIYQVGKGTLPEDQIKRRIIETLNSIRYNNGRGYYFIIDMTGGRELFPSIPEMRGKDVTGLLDAEGKYIFRDMVRIVREKGEGYSEYLWRKPGAEGEKHRKIAFITLFAPYDWIIGTGEYLDDVTSRIQREVIERLSRITFGQNGYLFGSTFDGEPLFTNGMITAGGPNVLDLTDPNGVKIIQIQRDAAQKPDGGFVEYSWKKLTSEEPSPKIAFVKSVPEWRWIIGSGFYADDVDTEILAKREALRAQVLSGIGKISVFFAASFAAIFLLALFLSRGLKSQFEAFAAFFNKAARERSRVDEADLPLQEFKDLAASANRMLSGRDAAEEAVREASKELDRYFSLSLDLLCIVGVDGYFRRANPTWEEILGRRVDEIEGRSLIDFAHPEEASGILDAIKHLGSGGKVNNLVNRLRCKDGSYRSIEWRAATADGLVYAVGRDISERLRLERELVSAKERAEDASRSKSEFLANMSHEIRTPLNGVLGMLQILRAMPLEGERKTYVETALASGRTLLALLNDILDLSKVEAGKMELRDAPFSITALFTSVAALFKEACEEKGLSLELDIAPDIPVELMGDEARLRQVLFNLVGNAVKFTAKGSVRIEASRIFSQNPAMVRLFISISDDGVGIPEKMLARVFERFTQSDGALQRKFQGAGLGLPIVKRILELMGGNISVESEEGAGTTVSFDLLLRPSQDDAAGQEEETRPASIAGARILVAEDEPINRMAIDGILRNFGCLPLAAANGREVLELLEKEDVDLILMDVQMPEIDGVEATRIIRDSGRFGEKSRIPIIALTAHAMGGDREKFLKAGMNDYLPKPVDAGTLRRIIGQALGKKPKARA
jgi:two-component system, sensor histidine kinase